MYVDAIEHYAIQNCDTEAEVMRVASAEPCRSIRRGSPALNPVAYCNAEEDASVIDLPNE